MNHAERVRAQLPHCLERTSLPLGERYQGKVRDVYRQGDQLVMVTTDRISAFDHVLGTIPFKGELLNRLTRFWFDKTRDVAANHLVAVPDPNVMICRRTEALPVEVVVRGYLTGSLWKDVQEQTAGAYGVEIPHGMVRDSPFAQAIITPSTKEAYGKHDQPISGEEIVRRGMVGAEVWRRACEKALALFSRGQAWALSRGLILVDTKYEMGLVGDELLVIDEMHTMDCSRYWVAAEYQARLDAGQDQRMLDKQNLRLWLTRERGFTGHGTPPPLPDEVRTDIALKYIAAYEQITGDAFDSEPGDPLPRIAAALADRAP